MAGKVPLESSISSSDFPVNQYSSTSKNMALTQRMFSSHTSASHLCSQFRYSQAQLDYQLNQWRFRQKMTKRGWNFVRHKISRRKRAGKRSTVILSGISLPPEVVHNETLRNRPAPKLGRVQRCKSPAHILFLEISINLCPLQHPVQNLRQAFR